jgi:dethiobiotin synthetase
LRPPIYITATGTDAGKTHILCELLRGARARGHAPVALKPVLSGYDPEDLESSDAGLLLAAMGHNACAESVDRVTPYRFTEAVAPDKAAAREGVFLLHSQVVDFCAQAMAEAQGPVFIEGAGGVMSPIASDGLNLDLIRSLDARPILICGAYLGAISHTLTAVAAMRANDVPPEITLINPHPAGPASPEEMAESLARFACPASIWTDGGAGRVLDALGL